MMSPKHSFRDGTAPLPDYQMIYPNPYANVPQDPYEILNFGNVASEQQTGPSAGTINDVSLISGLNRSTESETANQYSARRPSVSSIHSFELKLSPSPPDNDFSDHFGGQQQFSSMAPIIRKIVVPSPPEIQATFNLKQQPPVQDPVVFLGTQPYDVLKIKNLPFAVTIAEVKAFVNRLTTFPLIKDHEQGYPVHIIMERSTGKTMDCFVEFRHEGAATVAARRAEETTFEGKIIKMGARRVDVEVSSEGELCAALFPKAKSVHWDQKTGVPTILENEDPFSEGFHGFLTVEEITSVLKHASNPQKSTFMQRCQQRVYESMISTLYKFPWHIPKHYSVTTRNFLWSTYFDLLQFLVARVKAPDYATQGIPDKEVGLSQGLLLEYLFAGLNVQMFSLRQKFMIVHGSGPLGLGCPIPKQAMYWPFHTLTPDLNYSPEVIDEWLDVIDMGYKMCLAHRVRHGYENYLQLSRDTSNYLQIELSDEGRSLSFHDLISAEKGLAEVLVEHGRREYCQRRGIYYQPIDMWNRAPEGFGFAAVQTPMVGLKLTVLEEKAPADDASSSGLGSPIPNSPPPPARPYNNGSHLSEPPASNPRLNPTTPSFEPSQPRTTAKDDNFQGNGVPMHPLEYKLYSSVPDSRLPPEWRLSNRNFNGYVNDWEIDPSTATHGGSGGTTRYDPFRAGASPHAPRRTSLQSRRSSAGSDGLSKESNKHEAEGFHRANDNDERRYHQQNATWGHRGAYSAGAGSNNDQFDLRYGAPTPAHNQPTTYFQTFTNDYPRRLNVEPGQKTCHDFDPPHQDLQIRKVRELDTESHRLPYSFAEALEAANANRTGNQEKVGNWKQGSPSHGSKTRSSSSRNFVKVHATIEEESDFSAAGVTDVTEDTANDGGGVSVHARI